MCSWGAIFYPCGCVVLGVCSLSSGGTGDVVRAAFEGSPLGHVERSLSLLSFSSRAPRVCGSPSAMRNRALTECRHAVLERCAALRKIGRVLLASCVRSNRGGALFGMWRNGANSVSDKLKRELSSLLCYGRVEGEKESWGKATNEEHTSFEGELPDASCGPSYRYRWCDLC